MSNNPIERRSYAQRRELFKDIWNATMLFDDGDATDVTIKPKVIKTLHLEQSSHVKTSVRKKRLKNLRTVCNKILAFCDRQEQDDFYQNQIVSSDNNAKKSQKNKPSKTKKKKIVKRAKKSLYPSNENALAKPTDSKRKDRDKGDAAVPIDRARKRVKPANPIVTRAVPMVASQMTSKLTSTRSPVRNISSPIPGHQQKVIKKNSTKKKKSTDI